jgi:thioredoxin reductase (NADPH)
VSLDLIVVGGGPAGLSAGLVAHGNRLSVLVLEASARLGGALHDAHHPILDLLGVQAGDGPAVAARLAEHARAAFVPLRLEARVRAIRAHDDGFDVELEGEILRARAVLLASGTAPRRLGAPGEDYATPGPVAAVLDRAAGATVVVIGGGDEAAYSAALLAEHGATVEVLVRGELRARPLFLGPLLNNPQIHVHRAAKIRAIEGGPRVVLEDGRSWQPRWVFVRIGASAALPVLDPAPARSAEGVVVDASGQTSIPGLFAAGDLTGPPERRYVAQAIGQGAIVGRAVEALLSLKPPSAGA